MPHRFCRPRRRCRPSLRLGLALLGLLWAGSAAALEGQCPATAAPLQDSASVPGVAVLDPAGRRLVGPADDGSRDGRSGPALDGRAPVATRASHLRAAAGFLAGDALAIGVYAAGDWATDRSGEDYLGMAVATYMYTGVAALVAPPGLGATLAGPPRAGTFRGFVLGGLAHLAGVSGAAMLLRNDHRWAAAGVLLTVDVGLAPWLVVRSIDAAAQAATVDAPAAFARPADAAAGRQAG